MAATHDEHSRLTVARLNAHAQLEKVGSSKKLALCKKRLSQCEADKKSRVNAYSPKHLLEDCKQMLAVANEGAHDAQIFGQLDRDLGLSIDARSLPGLEV